MPSTESGSESEARSLSERVSAKGLGSTKPVKSNKTPEGQAANRRVDIVVL